MKQANLLHRSNACELFVIDPARFDELVAEGRLTVYRHRWKSKDWKFYDELELCRHFARACQ